MERYHIVTAIHKENGEVYRQSSITDLFKWALMYNDSSCLSDGCSPWKQAVVTNWQVANDKTLFKRLTRDELTNTLKGE